MKIGLVTGEFPPMQGGVGDYSRELALAFVELGHEVRVITDHRNAVTPDREQPYEVRAVTSPAWGLRDLWQVRKQTADLDIVNVQYQAAAYGRMRPPIHFLPRVLSRPAVVTFHDLREPYLFPKAGSLRQKAVLWLARSASGVIVTNREDFLQLHAEPAIGHLADIPIGSNIRPNPPAGFDAMKWRAAHDIPSDAFVLGYFGFFNSSKGGETLVEVLAQLVERGFPAKLLHIGGQAGSSDTTNRAYGAKVLVLAHDLGVVDHITQTGFLPPQETSAALLACDVMLMPYRDGASLRRGTFMACLNHGRPTITTQPVSPLPELVNGENVFLVPRDDNEATVAAVQTLHANADLRARIGRRANELSKSFTWDNIARQAVDFFEQVRAKIS